MVDASASLLGVGCPVHPLMCPVLLRGQMGPSVLSTKLRGEKGRKARRGACHFHAHHAAWPVLPLPIGIVEGRYYCGFWTPPGTNPPDLSLLSISERRELQLKQD